MTREMVLKGSTKKGPNMFRYISKCVFDISVLLTVPGRLWGVGTVAVRSAARQTSNKGHAGHSEIYIRLTKV